MKKLYIITLLLSAIALIIAYSLYASIKNEQDTYLLIRQSEKLIKSNLKGIREAQSLHKKQYGTYSPDWASLQRYIQTDSLAITDISETIVPRQYEDDSIFVSIDTLKMIAVRDSLFNRGKYLSLNLNDIKKVPLQPHDFYMHVAYDQSSNSNTLYIADTLPLDKMRRKPIIRNKKEKKIKGTKPLLSIGSKTDETLKASWTKE